MTSSSSFSHDLRRAAGELWEAQHAHPFVKGIEDGTLPTATFRLYVRQDYLFLIEYGRLLALGTARAPDLATMRRFSELTQGILVTEMDLHRSFAAAWGIGEDDLQRELPLPATRAYTDFLLRTAALGDFPELVAALLPCMWGYAEIGARLKPTATPDNPYTPWIETYAGDEFQELAAWCRELTDAQAEHADHARMHRAFRTCSEHELAFWESAWVNGAGSD